jgi:hypothetical protein
VRMIFLEGSSEGPRRVSPAIVFIALTAILLDQRLAVVEMTCSAVSSTVGGIVAHAGRGTAFRVEIGRRRRRAHTFGPFPISVTVILDGQVDVVFCFFLDGQRSVGRSTVQTL